MYNSRMNAAHQSSDEMANLMVAQLLDEALRLPREAIGEFLVALAGELGGVDGLLELYDDAQRSVCGR